MGVGCSSCRQVEERPLSPRGLPSAPQEQHAEASDLEKVELDVGASTPSKPKPKLERQLTLDAAVTSEEERAVYVPTPAQAKAAAAAETAQAEVARLADALPVGERNTKPEHWKSGGGPALEAMLDDADLVDVGYIIRLIEAGGIVPRWQDLPHCAKITRDNIWRLQHPLYWGEPLLPVIVLSYPWLDRDHPDRMGTQLTRLLPLLKLALKAVQDQEGGCGPHATFGLMMDYPCLPQKPFASDEEQARFKRGLGSINRWYAHPKTFVVLLNTPLPTDADYSNTRPHARRGWCRYETRAAALVKCDETLLEFSKFDAAKKYPRFRDACRAMKAGRPPPMAPPAFAAEMRREVKAGTLAFTAKADMEMVIEQYREGFVEAFETYPTTTAGSVLFWFNLGWGHEGAPQLIEALKYVCSRCEMTGRLAISMSGTGFGEADMKAVQAAVSGKVSIMRIE